MGGSAVAALAGLASCLAHLPGQSPLPRPLQACWAQRGHPGWALLPLDTLAFEQGCGHLASAVLPPAVAAAAPQALHGAASFAPRAGSPLPPGQPPAEPQSAMLAAFAALQVGSRAGCRRPPLNSHLAARLPHRQTDPQFDVHPLARRSPRRRCWARRRPAWSPRRLTAACRAAALCRCMSSWPRAARAAGPLPNAAPQQGRWSQRPTSAARSLRCLPRNRRRTQARFTPRRSRPVTQTRLWWVPSPCEGDTSTPSAVRCTANDAAFPAAQPHPQAHRLSGLPSLNLFAPGGPLSAAAIAELDAASKGGGDGGGAPLQPLADLFAGGGSCEIAAAGVDWEGLLLVRWEGGGCVIG